MTDRESEDLQAARELASLDRDDDPNPGACYGLPDPTNDLTSHDTPHA